MKILITGGGGQLGQDCHAVLSENHSVKALTSARLDITDPGQVTEVIQALAPELIINCAAYTRVDQAEEDRERCMAVNGSGPAHLARAARRQGARLIHISTDYVFDGRKPVPQAWVEGDPTEPLSTYGRSKLAGEQAIAREMDNFLILRTAWLYGMGGPNFLKTMLRLALADPQRTRRVVDDQYGSLTWTWRLARQIEALLPTDMTGIVHATAEGFSTWFAGAGHFLRAMEIPYRLEPCTTADYPTPAPRPTNSILENKRLSEAGINRMVPWEEDVTLFARCHREALLVEAGC